MNNFQQENRVQVGVGVMILKDSKILLGKRKSAHGEGQYASPGGHLEYMESFEDCARRETMEETGMTIKNVRFLFLANLKEYAPKHYTHVHVIADWESGEPKTMEPEKCEGWDWYDMNNMSSPRFGTVDKSIEAFRTGKIYWDA